MRIHEDLGLLVPQIPGDHSEIFVVEAGGTLVSMVVLDRRDPERPGRIRPDGAELEVSYTFLPAYWGRGYASEAVEEALKWA